MSPRSGRDVRYTDTHRGVIIRVDMGKDVVEARGKDLRSAIADLLNKTTGDQLESS